MNKQKKRVKRAPTTFEAAVAVLLSVGSIAFGMLTGTRIELCLIVSAVIVAVIAFRMGMSWDEMESAITRKIGRITPTLITMWIIGMMLGAMIFSGTVPMAVYYGFKIISPSSLYISSLLICTIMSTATGTSWGSAGTAGVVCMILARGFGANEAITAGAVICGAVFGDKMSPMSETTNLAPACAGTTLWKHIGAQIWTTAPAWLIAGVSYIILGRNLQSNGAGIPENALAVMEQLDQLYKWNIILLIPFVVVIVGSVMKKPVIPTLVLSSLSAAVLGVFYQGFPLSTCGTALINGFTVDSIAPAGLEINALVASLLNRGGIKSMAGVLIIAYCGISLTAILIHSGMMDLILQPMIRSLKGSRVMTMLSAEVAVFVVHALAGSSWPAAVFVGETWQEAFIRSGMGRQTLSRTLEDVGTTMSNLLPWASSGVFYVTTLGVPIWGAGGYAPYVFLPFLCPLFALLYAIIGFKIYKLSPEEIEKELAVIEAEKRDKPITMADIG